MDLGGITGKIVSNADKLGMILGAYGELNRYGKEWGMDPMGAGMNLFQKLISDPHIPNLGHLQMALFSENSMFKTSVIAAIAGWFMKEVDVIPQLDKIGNALMKAGVGAAEASFVINALVWSGAGHSSSGGADHGLGGGSHFGFLSGSRHNPHGAFTEPSISPEGTNLTRSAASSPSPY